jgi:hypothetical protein
LSQKNKSKTNKQIIYHPLDKGDGTGYTAFVSERSWEKNDFKDIVSNEIKI